jgi:hypothetical protein
MAMPENLRQEVLNETNVEVLRGLILIADEVIGTQATKLSLVTELLKAVVSATSETTQDARRYSLLKLQLPVLMEIAAYAGSQSDQAQEAFASLDPLKLDELLDAQLEAGVLEQLQAEIEEQAIADLDDLNADQAPQITFSAPAIAGPEDGSDVDYRCGDDECPFCQPVYN